MYEQSGRLGKAVVRFFDKRATEQDVPMLKEYLLHWMNCPNMQFSNEKAPTMVKLAIRECKTSDDINKVYNKMLELGVDPF